jgi:hypothetical protein
MTEVRDPVLRELAGLADPVLPQARTQQIHQLARARFLTRALQTPARRSTLARAPELVAAAVLCASVAGYLVWTAATVTALHPRAPGVMRERAVSGSPR